MDQKRTSTSTGTNVSVSCIVCSAFTFVYILTFLFFYQAFLWYMVTLGIRSMFLHHNAQERRDASTNTDEHKPLARPYGRLGTSQHHRVTIVTSSVVSSTTQFALGSGRARFRPPGLRLYTT